MLSADDFIEFTKLSKEKKELIYSITINLVHGIFPEEYLAETYTERSTDLDPFDVA
jgi:hypothetical protein